MNVKHNSIKTIEFGDLRIGGEISFPILNPMFVLNVPVVYPDKDYEISRSFYGTNDREKIIEQAQKSDCDILGLQFNIETLDEIALALDVLKSIKPTLIKPLLIQGVNKDDIDKFLLPELMKNLDQPAIIAFANDSNYKEIVPYVVSGGHILVLRSPIDINLAKELNILSADMGLDLNKILIDTDIGGLGYGFEYGYSIMEKVKLEGLKGDKYLNMPLISFGCAESLKTKEAKSDSFCSAWGNLEDRAKFIEIATASGLIAAGANVVVMNYPPNISVMKGLF